MNWMAGDRTVERLVLQAADRRTRQIIHHNQLRRFIAIPMVNELISNYGKVKAVVGARQEALATEISVSCLDFFFRISITERLRYLSQIVHYSQLILYV